MTLTHEYIESINVTDTGEYKPYRNENSYKYGFDFEYYDNLLADMLEGCGCVFVLIPDGKPEYALHMNVGIYAIMAAMGMFNTDEYPEVFKFRRWAWITYLDKIDRITMLDNKQSFVEFYRCLSPYADSKDYQNAYFEELLTDFCWYCREFKESLRKWTEIFVKQDVEIWIS